ncbi:ZIP zinc transporter-domain-containing protein [Gorgonomyces haynaldii]|nr:ZIP zinc transporter-domain-containing protein [Gorgonomyces haynaldii]
MCKMQDGQYTPHWHILGAFLMLLISLVGALVPIYTKHSNLKMFGAGVIVSTVFVHMMIPASLVLQDPCYQLNRNLGATLSMLGLFIAHWMNTLLQKREQSYGSITDPLIRHKTNALVLELGVSMHSILLGLGIGITSDDQFPVLMAAFLVHQFFEGIALSSVVMECRSRVKTLMTILFYSTSTPLGILLGVLIRVQSKQWLYMPVLQAVLETVCAGMLLFDILVNVILQHFESKTHFLSDLASLWTGALLMTLVGNWV